MAPSSRLSSADRAVIALREAEDPGAVPAAIAARLEEELGPIVRRETLTRAVRQARRRRLGGTSDAAIARRLEALHGELVAVLHRCPLGQRLRVALDVLGVPAIWLARRTGLSERRLSYWLGVEAVPRVGEAQQVADAFRCSLDEFWSTRPMGDLVVEMVARTGSRPRAAALPRSGLDVPYWR